MKKTEGFFGVSKECCDTMLLMEALHRADYDTEKGMREYSRLHASRHGVSIELSPAEKKKFDEFCRGSLIGQQKDFHKAAKAMGLRLETVLVHYYRWKARCQDEYVPMKLARKEKRIVCAICEDGGALVVCASCAVAFHLKCLSPPVDKFPDVNWYCDQCTDIQSSPRKVPPSSERIATPIYKVVDARLASSPKSPPAGATSADMKQVGTQSFVEEQTASPRDDSGPNCTSLYDKNGCIEHDTNAITHATARRKIFPLLDQPVPIPREIALPPIIDVVFPAAGPDIGHSEKMNPFQMGDEILSVDGIDCQNKSFSEVLFLVKAPTVSQTKAIQLRRWGTSADSDETDKEVESKSSYGDKEIYRKQDAGDSNLPNGTTARVATCSSSPDTLPTTSSDTAPDSSSPDTLPTTSSDTAPEESGKADAAPVFLPERDCTSGSEGNDRDSSLPERDCTSGSEGKDRDSSLPERDCDSSSDGKDLNGGDTGVFPHSAKGHSCSPTSRQPVSSRTDATFLASGKPRTDATLFASGGPRPDANLFASGKPTSSHTFHSNQMSKEESTKKTAPPEPLKVVAKSILGVTATAFLGSIGIFSAEQLLSNSTSYIGAEFQQWRMQEGMSELKGTGAMSAASGWKMACRKAAPDGDTRLPKKGRKKKELKGIYKGISDSRLGRASKTHQHKQKSVGNGMASGGQVANAQINPPTSQGPEHFGSNTSQSGTVDCLLPHESKAQQYQRHAGIVGMASCDQIANAKSNPPTSQDPEFFGPSESAFPPIIDAVLPLQPEGLLIMVGMTRGRVEFQGYRRLTSNCEEMGYAEKTGAFQIGDEIVMVDGVDCRNNSADRVALLLRAPTVSQTKAIRVRRWGRALGPNQNKEVESKSSGQDVVIISPNQDVGGANLLKNSPTNGSEDSRKADTAPPSLLECDSNSSSDGKERLSRKQDACHPDLLSDTTPPIASSPDTLPTASADNVPEESGKADAFPPSLPEGDCIINSDGKDLNSGDTDAISHTAKRRNVSPTPRKPLSTPSALPPIVDVILPIRPEGFLVNVGPRRGRIEFLGYRRGRNNRKEMGHAEKADSFQIGDEIIMVDGIDCQDISFDEVIELLKTSTVSQTKALRIRRWRTTPDPNDNNEIEPKSSNEDKVISPNQDMDRSNLLKNDTLPEHGCEESRKANIDPPSSSSELDCISRAIGKTRNDGGTNAFPQTANRSEISPTPRELVPIPSGSAFPRLIDVILPIRREGFLIQLSYVQGMRSRRARVEFTAYGKTRKGNMGHAEKIGAFQVGDEIVAIDGIDCQKKSFDEVVALMVAPTASRKKAIQARRLQTTPDPKDNKEVESKTSYENMENTPTKSQVNDSDKSMKAHALPASPPESEIIAAKSPVNKAIAVPPSLPERGYNSSSGGSGRNGDGTNADAHTDKRRICSPTSRQPVPIISENAFSPFISDFVLPVRPEGFLIQLSYLKIESSQSLKVVFTGYGRGPNGEVGYAEEIGAFQINDEIVAVDDIDCQNKSFSEVIALWVSPTASRKKRIQARRLGTSPDQT
jgi:hypothetical protein